MKTLTLKQRVFNLLDTKRAALIKRGSKATVPMSGVLDKAHGKLKSEAKDPSASYRMYHQMWLNDRGLYDEWKASGGVAGGQKGITKGPHGMRSATYGPYTIMMNLKTQHVVLTKDGVAYMRGHVKAGLKSVATQMGLIKFGGKMISGKREYTTPQYARLILELVDKVAAWVEEQADVFAPTPEPAPVNAGPTNWELAEHHQQLADKYFALGVADDKAAAQNNATVQ